MTNYYNGEPLNGPESDASQLSEKGMSSEEWSALLIKACQQTWSKHCCEDFMRIYESTTEEIDFGQRTLVGYEQLVITDMDPVGEKTFEWVHIKYCPFCGTRLFYYLGEGGSD